VCKEADAFDAVAVHLNFLSGCGDWRWFCIKLIALTTAGYTEMTKVLVNRHLAALAAALHRRGAVRGVAHERRARMPRLEVSGLHLQRSAQRTYHESLTLALQRMCAHRSCCTAEVQIDTFE
jgi:hypothetical protein